MSTKFPSYIPNFEGKDNKDLGDHVTTFHLYYSSTYLRDDSIQLCLFQLTLIGTAVKWYNKLDHSRYSTFGKLEMVFLNHFQLVMRYDAATKLLTKFETTTDDHISDHIREWRHRKCLIKVLVPPTFLLEWFLKSLVPQLSKDVAMSGVFLEEEAIMRAQQLELIYSQYSFIYEVLLDAPRPTLDKTRHKSGPHADDIVGSTQENPTDPLSNHLQQFLIQQTVANPTPSSAAPLAQTSDVHNVKSTNPKANQQAKGKKKK